MELKEIEKQIQLITGCSSLESGTIMIFIEQHGKEQYNQALEDAEERGAFWSDHHEEELLGVDTLHKLKKH